MSVFFFFLLLFISAIPAIPMANGPARSPMPCLGSILRSWVEAEKLCAEEGLQLATPHSREDVKARAGRGRAVRRGPLWGPKNLGRIWVGRSDWKTRSDLGEEKDDFGRCRFFRYFLIEWKYMGDAKEKMANGYPPMVGSFFALKTMSWWVVPYHIPSHQYERPDGHYCLLLSKKKTHIIPATQQKGGTVPSYILYIPLYHYWYPTISYPHYWLPNYISIISPDHIDGFHAPWATSATSNTMPNSWTKLMAESSIYIYTYNILYIIIYLYQLYRPWKTFRT